MKEKRLTPRDLDILHIISASTDPLSAAEIVKSKEGLTKNTVQAELRKLLNADFIKIADIGYSGTVLCRKYLLTKKAEEYLISSATAEYESLAESFSTSTLVSHLLKKEKDKDKLRADIDALDELISQYKSKLK